MSLRTFNIGVTSSGGSQNPVQLLDFDGVGTLFSRNNGFNINGEASARTESGFADFSSDTLRTDIVSGVSLYLFERQRSSLVIRSDDWSLGWIKSGATTTFGFAGPKGDSSATECVFTSVANAQLSQTISNANTNDGDVVHLGVWLRGATGGEQLRLGCLKRDATYDLDTITLTTEWVYYSRAVNLGVGAGNTQFLLWNSNPGVAKTFYLQRASKIVESYPSSRRLIVASLYPRYADSLLIAPDEVPLLFRTGVWSCTVRPEWSDTDLSTGERRVICSTSSDTWIGFEESAGSVYLRCYTAGVLRFGTSALSVTRDTNYDVICDLSNGQMTFDGIAGAVGTPTSLPGGEVLRWGGLAGGNDELDGGCSEPFTV